MPTLDELLSQKENLYELINQRRVEYDDLCQRRLALHADLCSLRRAYESLDREIFLASATERVKRKLANVDLERIAALAREKGEA